MSCRGWVCCKRLIPIVRCKYFDAASPSIGKNLCIKSLHHCAVLEMTNVRKGAHRDSEARAVGEQVAGYPFSWEALQRTDRMLLCKILQSTQYDAKFLRCMRRTEIQGFRSQAPSLKRPALWWYHRVFRTLSSDVSIRTVPSAVSRLRMNAL